MSLTVCKFGGSSLADAGMFMRVDRILRSDAARRYIIVSAPGARFPGDVKITDLFYRAHSADGTGDHSILAQIFARYAEIRDALAPDFDLEAEFARLRADLHISLDYAASRGEYLCAKLFAACTDLPFVDAAELLHFDSDGEIDMDATVRAVRGKLLPLGRAVVPGFYGVTPDCGVRTFTRGGSDVSGALVAAALGADLYENWTDVNGLFTADPSIVPLPARNLTVGLTEMEHIAAAGAKLLHPDALRPLHGTGIDTLLKNTFAPDAPGTRVSEACAQPVRCVTGKAGLYMLDDPTQLRELPLQNSIKVASVCAFGLTTAGIRRVEREIRSIHIIHMQDHIQIIIPDPEYENTIRAVHAILMQSAT